MYIQKCIKDDLLGKIVSYPKIGSTKEFTSRKIRNQVRKKVRKNQQHAFILKANYYLSVCNVHFKLTLSTVVKNVLIDPILPFLQ